MGKINNVVRKFNFKDDMDLYMEIDKFLSTDLYRIKVSKPYRVKSINSIDENSALVYMEEDLSVLPVHFFYDLAELIPSEEPHTEEYMTYEEIQLINSLGSVTIEEKTYDVDEIKYSINSYGVRSVDIYLS